LWNLAILRRRYTRLVHFEGAKLTSQFPFKAKFINFGARDGTHTAQRYLGD
jgi:hypothetical protein